MKKNMNTIVCRLGMLLATISLFVTAPLSAQDKPREDGLFLSKNINNFNYEDLSGTITLQGFVTGEMKLISSPVDVILVLDVSVSMSGDKFNKMKSAAKNLIDQLSKTDDTRLGIVSFSKGAKVESGFLKISGDNITTLKGVVDALEMGDYTAINLGVGFALDMFKNSSTSDRLKYCIVLTDGNPYDASQSYDEYEIAEQAWQTTWEMKQESMGAKVYSLYVGSTGLTTSFHHGDYYLDVKNFLDGLSSNFPTAWWNNSGESTSSSNMYKYWKQYAEKRKDAADASRTSSDYFKNVSDPSSLDDVFKGIGAQIIGQASKKLPVTTVMKDIFSTNASLPAGAVVSSVKTYTATCTGGDKTDGYTFGDKEVYSEATVTITESGNVTIGGFDYSGNWVGYNASTGYFQGKKLIVEIPFKLKGASVLGHTSFSLDTNGPKSGLYEKDEDADPIAGFTFDVPTVAFVDLVIKMTGLLKTPEFKGDAASTESAVFKIERQLTGESSYTDIGRISLTAADDKGSIVQKMIRMQAREASYRVTNLTGWTWTYTPDGSTSVTKGKDDIVENELVFEFAANKIPAEEISARNNEKEYNPYR